jgi:hypothetical protein
VLPRGNHFCVRKYFEGVVLSFIPYEFTGSLFFFPFRGSEAKSPLVLLLWEQVLHKGKKSIRDSRVVDLIQLLLWEQVLHKGKKSIRRRQELVVTDGC